MRFPRTMATPQAPSKRHPGSLFQPALSAFQPIASHATQLVRIRRRETPPGPKPRPPARREPSDAPRAAENRPTLRLGSHQWPRRRRLRRTRPRTRAASRAQKTRTVTGTAASSGTRALSAAPVAPATVPSGTRRLRRPSTLLFLPARDPTSPRPLSSNLHQF